MIWSLVLFPSLALAFSWTSLFGGSVASDQYVLQPVNTTNQLRVAIVGAGAAGSSAAFWISKAAERLGKDIAVDVYESSDYIGGRSTVVYPYNNSASFRPSELGASIFVDANKNLVRAAQHFSLEVETFKEELEQIGIWDGSNIIVTIGAQSYFGKIWENLKLLWRYGYRSPTTTIALVQMMTKSYLSLFSTTTHWGSVAEVSAALNFTEIVAQDSATYLANQGVGDAYAYEVVESSTRVNYGQNLDQIHAVEGLVSMASGGAKAIKGGNFQIFENFLRESKASVLLNTRVTGLESKSAGRWSLCSCEQTNGEQSTVVEEYDAVILAAPFDTLGMSLPSDLEPVIPSPYVQLHVTLLTTASPAANPVYFNQAPGSDVPGFILTTAQGIRAGGPAPEFNSMSYGHRIAEGSDERIVKIFSEKKIEDWWLSNMFGNVGWVYRKVWDAYPKLPPTTKFSPMKLDNNLYYVNGFERLISTMDTETIASRGVVDLMLRDILGEGICPSGVSAPPPEGVEFVWGWDC